MAHAAQREFLGQVAQAFPDHFARSDVLEIGSYDINGSARKFVREPNRYLGIDLAEGPGVDVVANGATFSTTQRFDLILSGECLEHNPEWEPTLRNAASHLRNDGLLVLTFATIGRPEHGTSRSLPDYSPATVKAGWEYYRNLTTAEVAAVLTQCGLTVWCASNLRSFDGYVLASPDPDVIHRAAGRGGPLRTIRRRLRVINLTPFAVTARLSHRLTGTRQPDQLPRPLRTLRRRVQRTERALHRIVTAGFRKGR